MNNLKIQLCLLPRMFNLHLLVLYETTLEMQGHHCSILMNESSLISFIIFISFVIFLYDILQTLPNGVLHPGTVAMKP